jgi:hypothetical protein
MIVSVGDAKGVPPRFHWEVKVFALPEVTFLGNGISALGRIAVPYTTRNDRRRGGTALASHLRADELSGRVLPPEVIWSRFGA